MSELKEIEQLKKDLLIVQQKKALLRKIKRNLEMTMAVRIIGILVSIFCFICAMIMLNQDSAEGVLLVIGISWIHTLTADWAEKDLCINEKILVAELYKLNTDFLQ